MPVFTQRKLLASHVICIHAQRESTHNAIHRNPAEREKEREEKRERKKAAANILWKKPNKYHLYSLMWISRCSRKRCPTAAPPFIPRSPPPLPSLCGSVPFPVRFRRRTVRSVRRFSCRSTAAFDSVDSVDAEEDKKHNDKLRSWKGLLTQI